MQQIIKKKKINKAKLLPLKIVEKKKIEYYYFLKGVS